MTHTSVRVHIDDRGASRQLADMWIPHLAVDVVWLVGAPPPEDQPAPLGVPIVELSAVDAVAVAAEIQEEDRRVLAVFTSPVHLETAAGLGLPPCRATLTHLTPDGETRRLAHEIEVDQGMHDAFATLEARGFTFEIQPLPNVTPRAWSPTVNGANGAVDANSAER